MTRSRFGTIAVGVIAAAVGVLAVVRLRHAADLAFGGWLFDFRTFTQTARCLLTPGCQAYQELPGASPDLMAPLPHVVFMLMLGLGLAPAWAAWVVASGLFCCLATRIVAEECRLELDVAEWCLVAALACASSVAMASVRSGQIYAAMTLPLVIAWRADRRGVNPILVGAVLGVLVAVKPSLWLFVPWFLRRRRFRSAAAMIVGAVAVLALGIALFGLGTTTAWVHALGRTAFNGDFSDGSAWQTGTRLFQPTRFFQPLVVSSIAASFFGWLVASVVVVPSLGRDEGDDVGWLMVIAGGLLISPKGWIYAGPWLVAPAVGVWRSSEGAPRALLAIAAAALVALPEAAPLWGQPNRWLTPWLGSTVFWAWFICWTAAFLSRHRTTRSFVPSG